MIFFVDLTKKGIILTHSPWMATVVLAVAIFQFDNRRGVQPVAHGPHTAQDDCECSPIHNRKFT